MIEGYHKLTRAQQLQVLLKATGIDFSNLKVDSVHQEQIENYLTDFSLPEGIGVNLKVNGKEYVVPMVTEEPSVIAAASNGAKIVSQAGGFIAQSQRLVIGQLLISKAGFEVIDEYVKINQEKLLEIANAAHPSMQKRGGGALKMSARRLDTNKTSVDLFVDTKEAMGANTLNSMLEALKVDFEKHVVDVDMAILSNLADQALTVVTCKVPTKSLGDELAQKIVLASEYAQVDPYRAATHNKGIMNGIDAVVIATGNDWRAVESGAHAYAARDGQYRGLSTWKISDDQLVGKIQLPLPVATVGGSIGINAMAQLNLKILGSPNAKRLAEIIGSVGLAQNFAALKAIVSEGIQRGHMRLQAKSLLLEHGAPNDKLSEAVELLVSGGQINAQNAKKVVEEIRKKDMK
ncbi:hydroxymethylglutaryl-CoA reductase, degradative [Pediococcus stilesii]|uniref:3-hydroxy-3-methylglutaryl coenzyme A reductase n=1 Tax=Pediococcus stilesii TaxID=331679 RepID=A0A0R2KVX7_9LACO|nr:hydroxymethylglutaryl-CoA reductase, degradative [Pediococcus stilesii]KRN93650.1 hydroxymethylglutaryl-CoA reductase, degradative [Pediococcus stilesii]